MRGAVASFLTCLHDLGINYIFMPSCLIKHRDKLSFIFYLINFIDVPDSFRATIAQSV
jgi:hypothetical protein